MRRHPLYSNTTSEQSSKLQTSLSTSIMSKSSKDGGKEKKVMKATKINSIPEDDNERSSESEQDGSNTNTSHDNSIHLKN